MSESCNHNCESCSENCSQRTAQSFLEPLHPQSSVKKVIGVVSGKGGVGKSLVTSLTACGLRARGHRVGILDADVGGVIKQFWSEALWKDIDYMLVDMPPGTGDVPLTVFQSLPLNGIIIVTSPQELVSMIVAKAVNMARKMDIPILGLVENMSYLECPDCKKRISVFGESRVEETAKEYGIPVLAKIPIDPKIADAVDQGAVEYIEAPWLAQAVDAAERV